MALSASYDLFDLLMFKLRLDKHPEILQGKVYLFQKLGGRLNFKFGYKDDAPYSTELAKLYDSRKLAIRDKRWKNTDFTGEQKTIIEDTNQFDSGRYYNMSRENWFHLSSLVIDCMQIMQDPKLIASTITTRFPQYTAFNVDTAIRHLRALSTWKEQ